MSPRPGEEEEEDEDYFLPLQDQRVFGAGIRRKRVPFVRSSEHELNTTATPPSSSASSTQSGPTVADKYLSIVLKKPPSTTTTSPSTPTQRDSPPPSRATQSAPPCADTTSPRPPPPTGEEVARCEVCNLPLPSPDDPSTPPDSRPHGASLAHQLCLTHSHPPSHLDRTRAGLRYLSSYGWDPDSRLGLGAPGREGIREPLKGRVKNDTVGLGVGRDADGDRVPVPPPPEKNKVQRLNAKQVRKGAVEERRRGERLREMFFQRDDVLKYLGGEAG